MHLLFVDLPLFSVVNAWSPPHSLPAQALTEFFGTLSAEWAMDCLKELLVSNPQVRRGPRRTCLLAGSHNLLASLRLVRLRLPCSPDTQDDDAHHPPISTPTPPPPPRPTSSWW